jgi:hypothetical protein
MHKPQSKRTGPKNREEPMPEKLWQWDAGANGSRWRRRRQEGGGITKGKKWGILYLVYTFHFYLHSHFLKKLIFQNGYNIL